MNNFKKSTQGEINYEKFIESNQMIQELDWLFEEATEDILNFWSIFKDERANVSKAYTLAL